MRPSSPHPRRRRRRRVGVTVGVSAIVALSLARGARGIAGSPEMRATVTLDADDGASVESWRPARGRVLSETVRAVDGDARGESLRFAYVGEDSNERWAFELDKVHGRSPMVRVDRGGGRASEVHWEATHALANGLFRGEAIDTDGRRHAARAVITPASTILIVAENDGRRRYFETSTGTGPTLRRTLLSGDVSQSPPRATDILKASFPFQAVYNNVSRPSSIRRSVASSFAEGSRNRRKLLNAESRRIELAYVISRSYVQSSGTDEATISAYITSVCDEVESWFQPQEGWAPTFDPPLSAIYLVEIHFVSSPDGVNEPWEPPNMAILSSLTEPLSFTSYFKQLSHQWYVQTVQGKGRGPYLNGHVPRDHTFILVDKPDWHGAGVNWVSYICGRADDPRRDDDADDAAEARAGGVDRRRRRGRDARGRFSRARRTIRSVFIEYTTLSRASATLGRRAALAYLFTNDVTATRGRRRRARGTERRRRACRFRRRTFRPRAWACSIGLGS